MSHPNPSQLKTAPGVQQALPFGYGHVRRFQRDPLQFWMDGMRRFGDVFRFQIGPERLHLLSHPDHVKYVLVDRPENYPRGQFFEVLKLGPGDALVTTDGDFWRTHFHMVIPAFDPKRVAPIVSTIIKATADRLERWQVHAKSGQPFDILEELLLVQWRILWQFLIGVDVGTDDTPLRQTFESIGRFINWRCVKIVVFPPSFPTPRNLRLRRDMGNFNKAVYDIITSRRADVKDTGDLLSVLLKARHPKTGQGLTDQQIRDELVGILMPGYEPGALVFAWACHLLASNPPTQDLARKEVAEVLGGRHPTPEDIPRLPYLNRVINETIRLYPSIWQTVRVCASDDDIGGFYIPKGAVMVLSPYVSHRHPKIWEDPEKFDPDRFLPENVAKRSPHAFFPWGMGEHECTGRDFQLLETPLILAMILQKYHLQTVPGQVVKEEGRITVRPANRVLKMIVQEG